MNISNTSELTLTILGSTLHDFIDLHTECSDISKLGSTSLKKN